MVIPCGDFGDGSAGYHHELESDVVVDYFAIPVVG